MTIHKYIYDDVVEERFMNSSKRFIILTNHRYQLIFPSQIHLNSTFISKEIKSHMVKGDPSYPPFFSKN
jgi:hypothetical protein